MRNHYIAGHEYEVRALLAGATQIRRPVKATVEGCTVGAYTTDGRLDIEIADLVNIENGEPVDGPTFRCPFGAPGDQLYVKERFSPFDSAGSPCLIRAADYVVLSDGAQVYRDGVIIPGLAAYADGAFDQIKWRSASRMPGWAMRTIRQVVNIRVERLQLLTEAGAKALGALRIPKWHDTFSGLHYESMGFNAEDHRVIAPFASTWDAVYADTPYAWALNPWVWVGDVRS